MQRSQLGVRRGSFDFGGGIWGGEGVPPPLSSPPQPAHSTPLIPHTISFNGCRFAKKGVLGVVRGAPGGNLGGSIDGTVSRTPHTTHNFTPRTLRTIFLIGCQSIKSRVRTCRNLTLISCHKAGVKRAPIGTLIYLN